MRMPDRKNLEMFGVVVQLHGTNKVRVLAEDGVERICRIPGKMKKKVWMRQGDLVLIKLWDFQKSKADIAWRYMGAQAEHLKKKGYVGNLPF